MSDFVAHREKLRILKRVMDSGIGAPPGGFPTLQTNSKKMRAAKGTLRKIKFAARHPQAGQPMFSEADILGLTQANKLAVKMIAFVESQGILNLHNDDASPHPQRLAAFHGVREVAYQAMSVEEFDYAAITPNGLMAMGTHLATLRSGL